MQTSDLGDKLSSTLSSVKGLVKNVNEEHTKDPLTSEQRDAVLQRELQRVKQINQVIGGVIDSLHVTNDNLNTVAKGVMNADTQLDIWVDIMSKTEHIQNLMFREDWQGTSRDETLWRQKQEALKRKEEERRLEALRKQKQEEQRLKRLQEAEEAKRQKDEALRRIVYGKRGSSSTPGPKSRTSSIINKGVNPGSMSQTRRRPETASSKKPQTTTAPRSNIPTRSNPSRR
ncbi:hypothetical protein NADFUDRAFT_39246 [Nadsonia fulvescens var. elongata DSM 6958]|uniref:DASH complex subunit DUO1 n=1 Tax=Nadsonia fulvescens var. elongata DSM 6958 TaxID=857566 RepID=A0A1E3PQZ3_9ASCO|nr:hypothetical protein NADFUDRAFT_39246 [Nadsonia fulvescens var. elongata DSM 6958]